MEIQTLAAWEYRPSERVCRLRDAVVDETPDARKYQGYRHLHYAEGFAAAAGQPLAVRRAEGLARVIRSYPVEVFPDEVLVGHHYVGDEGLDFPEFWLAKEWRERLRAQLQPEEYDRVMALAETYPVLFANQRQVCALPAETLRASERGVHQIWGTTLNHSVRGYEKVLRLGFEGILAEVDAAIAAVAPEEPSAPERLTFLQAARAIAAAGCAMGERYAEHAEAAAAGCSDPERARELREIAAVCRQVPARPARTFREAVQALWFAHVITCWEDTVNANSIGRIDQILAPYYQREADLGLITLDEAAEWLAHLWVKLYRSYDVQQATVGGLLSDGTDATNDLSTLVLEVTRALDFVRCLSVRVHRGSPRPLLEKAAQLVARGGGIPFFFNDDAIVPALVRNGIPLEDARGYAVIGCVEITIPGKASPHAVSGWLNLAKCLELALNDGCDLRTGDRLGPATGGLRDFRSMEEVWRSYQAQVEHFSRQIVFGCNRAEVDAEHAIPLPYLSLLTEDCVRAGKDITAGGARYNYHGVAAVGIPNVADSLAALEALTPLPPLPLRERGSIVGAQEQSARLAGSVPPLPQRERGPGGEGVPPLPLRERGPGGEGIPPADLHAALLAGFEGQETLRQMLLNRAPKFGNDQDAVDRLAAEVTRHYCEVLAQFRTVRDGRFLPSLFTFTLMLPLGHLTGALPDGRRHGDPLAYSISPSQGRDQEGLTALLQSLARIPNDLVAASTSAIVEVEPSLLEGSGFPRFVDALQAAIAQGVGQMQFNVVSAETLRRAQEHPEQYRNLCVRVSGFSQKFSLLGREMQDHIIARTKHAR